MVKYGETAKRRSRSFSASQTNEKMEQKGSSVDRSASMFVSVLFVSLFHFEECLSTSLESLFTFGSSPLSGHLRCAASTSARDIRCSAGVPIGHLSLNDTNGTKRTKCGKAESGDTIDLNSFILINSEEMKEKRCECRRK